MQSFALHIGAELRLPTPNRLDTHTYDPVPAQVQAERAAARNPFEGLPLQAWADRMGERVMPAFEVCTLLLRPVQSALFGRANLSPVTELRQQGNFTPTQTQASGLLLGHCMGCATECHHGCMSGDGLLPLRASRPSRHSST